MGISSGNGYALIPGTITGSGHSNIFSNSLSPTTATVVSAIRTYNNRQYFFNNLTFNMPSNVNTDASDWTAPANSTTYKWSYIYIRPTDNKFFISNDAPSVGNNSRTIGSSFCLYLFPAYTSSTTITSFDLNNNKCSMFANPRSTYDMYETGLGIRYDWGVNQTVTFSAADVIPVTAGNVYTAFRRSMMTRSDSGSTNNFTSYIEVQNKSGSWILVGKHFDWIYTKTPTPTGGYFIRSHTLPFEVTLSRNIYNFAQCRYTWGGELNDNSGYNGMGWWMKGFDDVCIF